MIDLSKSKLKTALRHPKEAFKYLILGPQKYYFAVAEKRVHDAEKAERNIKPVNILEEHMVKPTDIHEHLATLYMLTVELGLKTTLELGTRGGESTVALLEAAKQIGGHVYSVDINPCLEAKLMIRNYGLEKYWTFIQAYDLKIEWDKPINHLFVDTSHTYDQTIKELEKFEPFVKRGGVITMHDIVTFPEVFRALSDYINGRVDLRVYKYFNNNGLAIIFKRP